MGRLSFLCGEEGVEPGAIIFWKGWMKGSITAALLLAVLPAAAGVFDQFADIGDMTSHLLSGGPPRDGIPAMTNPEFIDAEEATLDR
jgi:hypothetical protein